MKLNKITKAMFMIASLTVVSSCTMNVAFFPYTPDPNISETSKVYDYDTYERVEAFNRSYYDVLVSNKNESSKVVPIRSSGEQKILVLPVNFVDYNLNDLDNNNGETAHIHLQNSFFGAAKETRWHSVSSFYYASSYGKLLLTGEVAPWYTLPEDYSISAIRARIRNNNDKIIETAKIVNLALQNFERTFPGKINEFDQDNDGIVDSIYVIYSTPYETKENNNIFWAFAANMNRKEPSLTKQANSFSWSSYHYLDVKLFRKPDAHTYIHEVGHLLGLNDYYNTNYSEKYNAIGGFDLMDYTLGDHTGLSKMLLDWTTPYVMKESGTVKLYPFSKTGDLLLLKPRWNGRATDEYILLEYYTPTDLNERDSNLNASFSLPKANGIKVYHVDARTVNEIRSGSVTTYEYTTTNDFDGTQLLAHSNTTGSLNSAPMKNNRLYALIEPKESTNISEDYNLANMYSLFRTGDDFGINYFKNFTFNDRIPFGYTFKVKALTSAYASIEVEVL